MSSGSVRFWAHFLLGARCLDKKKIVDNADKDRYNKCKESKEYDERRLLYGTCKGYIKRADYNTYRD